MTGTADDAPGGTEGQALEQSTHVGSCGRQCDTVTWVWALLPGVCADEEQHHHMHDTCARCCSFLSQRRADGEAEAEEAEEAKGHLHLACLVAELMLPRTMVELSLDPMGSKLVQWVLEELALVHRWVATAAQLAIGLRGHVFQVATSTHGIWVLKKIIDLKLDPAFLVAELMLPRTMVGLSLDPEGCWLVQWVLEDLVLRQRRAATAAQLALGLRGHVLQASTSPHGIWVLKKIIDLKLDGEPLILREPSVLQLITEEMCAGAQRLSPGDRRLAPAACFVAENCYGCRILVQLLEEVPHHARRVIDAALENLQELLTHGYGHHPVEKVLEHGLPHQQAEVVAALLRNLPDCVTNKSGKYVLLNALRRKKLQLVHRKDLARHLLALDWRPTSRDELGHQIVIEARRIHRKSPQ